MNADWYYVVMSCCHVDKLIQYIFRFKQWNWNQLSVMCHHPSSGLSGTSVSVFTQDNLRFSLLDKKSMHHHNMS